LISPAIDVLTGFGVKGTADIDLVGGIDRGLQRSRISPAGKGDRSLQMGTVF
jgi:hypothetical protein